MTQIKPSSAGSLKTFNCAHLSRSVCDPLQQARQKGRADTLKGHLVAKENQMEKTLITASTIALLLATGTQAKGNGQRGANFIASRVPR